MHSSGQQKSHNDFIDSPYYKAFVKFGRHAIGIRAINPEAMVDWLIKNNKKLDNWCKDALYLEWLQAYLRKEAVQDAIERALKEMQDYAETNTELNNNFSNYFKHGNVNRICHHIVTGRISPWVLYNSNSAEDALKRCTPEQIGMIFAMAPTAQWTLKLKADKEGATFVKDTLKKAGL
jgi:hypothetical protein